MFLDYSLFYFVLFFGQEVKHKVGLTKYNKWSFSTKFR